MKESIQNNTAENQAIKAEEISEAHVESGVNTAPEKITNKGEERFNQISSSISGARERVSSWVKRGATGLGRLFKGAAIGALSAPEATGAAYKYAETKVNNFDKAVGEKVENIGEVVGYKLAEGASFVEGVAVSSYEFTADKAKQAKEFVKTKGEQASNYANEKIDLAKAVGSLAKERTVEGLQSVGNKLSNNFESTKKYGKSAIETATLRAWYARDAFNSKMNSIKKSILERKAEMQNEKLQQTLSKLRQMETVGNLEASMAA